MVNKKHHVSQERDHRGKERALYFSTSFKGIFSCFLNRGPCMLHWALQIQMNLEEVLKLALNCISKTGPKLIIIIIICTLEEGLWWPTLHCILSLSHTCLAMTLSFSIYPQFPQKQGGDNTTLFPGICEDEVSILRNCSMSILREGIMTFITHTLPMKGQGCLQPRLGQSWQKPGPGWGVCGSWFLLEACLATAS